MRMRPRTRIALAGRTCLLVGLSLSLGCWSSQPKHEAADQSASHSSGALAATGQTSAKAPEASSLSKLSAKTDSGTDEFGFKRALQPSPSPPATSAKAAAVAASRPDESDRYADRYAESAPAIAVGKRVETSAIPPASQGIHGQFPDDLHPPNSAVPVSPPSEIAVKPPEKPKSSGPSTIGAPATVVPSNPRVVITEPLKPDSPSGDGRPSGNPLRDPHAAEAAGRPEDPPQPAGHPDPVIPPERPATRNVTLPQPAHKSESVIQIRPDPATSAPPAVPAAEKNAEPSEHNPAPVKTKYGPRTNKNSGVPYDYSKENGVYFKDWPKPRLALVITGQQQGYLEPCGCAGMDRMKGGMSRRYELFRQLRQDYHWPVFGLDVGGLVKDQAFGKQAELKFQIAVNAMNEMHYNSVTLGVSDLHLPTADVMALTMPPNAQQKTMFVCGNVGLFAFEESLLPRTQLVAAGFKTIGVTAVVGKTYIDKLKGNPDLKIEDPEKLLDEAVPMLKARANYLILLAHAKRSEAIELGKKYPDFNLVVCSDGGAEPPNEFEELRKGGTKLIEVGEKGKYAVVLGMFDDPQQPMRYQRVALDSRFKESPQMRALMAAYQGQLKDLGLSGLGIRPLPLSDSLKKSNGSFVGNEACTNCHEESYRVWKKSAHSHAFETLKTANPPRNFDPECISCHTVGWNPTLYFPYESGYLSEKETPKLINVGCEDCHGPGEVHTRAENHGTKAQQIAARKTVAISKEEAADPKSAKQNCWSCHDGDNSPEFNFNLYWPFVEHHEQK
jgi:hypothetical protein